MQNLQHEAVDAIIYVLGIVAILVAVSFLFYFLPQYPFAVFLVVFFFILAMWVVNTWRKS